jgi:DNA-binding GntR family transcriptional regulator
MLTIIETAANIGTIMKDKEASISTNGVQMVAEAIKEAIATSQLKHGQRLIESQLCGMFGVKRNRIREALRKLEHEGFVKITPNVGAAVAEFSRGEIEHIYDLLSVLDGLAVRLATPFITAEQIEKLEKLAKRMETTDKSPAFTELNGELHALFYSFSGNNRLISLSENLRLSIRAFGYQSFLVPGQIPTSREEHGRIVQAMKENEPVQAEQLIRKHVIDAKNRLIKWLYRSL